MTISELITRLRNKCLEDGIDLFDDWDDEDLIMFCINYTMSNIEEATNL